jgi:hypothetical protein
VQAAAQFQIRFRLLSQTDEALRPARDLIDADVRIRNHPHQRFLRGDPKRERDEYEE